ncbi:T7SS effector LXG polymorphic toxin [Ruminococcus albus]|uniref:LXG domain of WXG superfamily protein n=1 Tax=Ruminococcus albus TaxID=1264 RepID=A0A1H7LUS7_RUMAL|nr:T7SS effector LXG polymorphic toxin [Ruminococcus albus]SEL02706.1 LXG domain of WXG superfamily protein [Ruminococcus albus]
MGYKIKYEDMYSLLWSFNSDMNYLIETVDNYKSALDSYLNTSAMSGETADAVYNYFQEVHYVFLDSIKQIAQAFLDNFAGYKAGYYSIDLSTKFVLDEEGIEATKDKLADIYEIFTDESAKVNSAISDIDSIDGVEHYDAPGDQGIPTSHDNLNTKLTDLDTNISDFESTTVTSIDNSIETLMALFIKSLESLFVPSQVEPNRYVAGTFGENPYAAAEIYMNEILQQNHDNNVEILNSIWENETELHELAEARKVQGIWKAVGGGVLIVVGVVCIVGTAGAATPIVVGGWVAGGGTVAFGAADLIEGGQDIYHGSTGDLDTSSFNYIRDTVFMGNQKVYDITEEVFSFAAGAMCPIGAAQKAGTLTWRSGGVILGQEVLGEAAGYGGSYFAGQFTDNEKLKLLAGVGASILVGHAGDRIDTHFNLSGTHVNVPNAPDIDSNHIRPDLDSIAGDVNEGGAILNSTHINASSSDVESYLRRGVDIPDHIKDRLSFLQNKGDLITGSVGEFSMSDVSIMSKETGVEFAHVTVGDTTYLIRGDVTSTVIPYDILDDMKKNNGIWDFHSHPFDDDCIPSPADQELLKDLYNHTGQSESVIITPNGKKSTFGPDGVISIDTIPNTIDADRQKALLELFGGE